MYSFVSSVLRLIRILTSCVCGKFRLYNATAKSAPRFTVCRTPIGRSFNASCIATAIQSLYYKLRSKPTVAFELQCVLRISSRYADVQTISLDNFWLRFECRRCRCAVHKTNLTHFIPRERRLIIIYWVLKLETITVWVSRHFVTNISCDLWLRLPSFCFSHAVGNSKRSDQSMFQHSPHTGRRCYRVEIKFSLFNAIHNQKNIRNGSYGFVKQNTMRGTLLRERKDTQIVYSVDRSAMRN